MCAYCEVCTPTHKHYQHCINSPPASAGETINVDCVPTVKYAPLHIKTVPTAGDVITDVPAVKRAPPHMSAVHTALKAQDGWTARSL